MSNNIQSSTPEITITCPYCGREYLPAEIYIPSSFLGHPTDIDRFTNGKIDAYDGKSMDLTERYACDGCGNEFEVTASVKFRASKVVEKFNPTYVSSLYSNRISLFEGK